MTPPPAIVPRLSQGRESGAAYGVYLEGVHAAALEATAGVLVNARGRAAGIDSWSLLAGPGHHLRLRAYGSPELLEYLEARPAMTFQEWEVQHGQVPGRSWGDLIQQAEGYGQPGVLFSGFGYSDGGEP